MSKAIFETKDIHSVEAPSVFRTDTIVKDEQAEWDKWDEANLRNIEDQEKQENQSRFIEKTKYGAFLILMAYFIVICTSVRLKTH